MSIIIVKTWFGFVLVWAAGKVTSEIMGKKVLKIEMQAMRILPRTGKLV